MTTNDLLEILKSKKKRITPGRVKIVNIICNSKVPVTAESLIERVGMNKTSIYREIEFLLKLNLIQEVDFGDGKKRYELKSLSHHHHLICLNCKKVSDVNIKERFEMPKNFKMVKHNLEFFGFCASCQ